MIIDEKAPGDGHRLKERAGSFFSEKLQEREERAQFRALASSLIPWRSQG